MIFRYRWKPLIQLTCSNSVFQFPRSTIGLMMKFQTPDSKKKHYVQIVGRGTQKTSIRTYHENENTRKRPFQFWGKHSILGWTYRMVDLLHYYENRVRPGCLDFYVQMTQVLRNRISPPGTGGTLHLQQSAHRRGKDEEARVQTHFRPSNENPADTPHVCRFWIHTIWQLKRLYLEWESGGLVCGERNGLWWRRDRALPERERRRAIRDCWCRRFIMVTTDDREEDWFSQFLMIVAMIQQIR